jgi:beta-glucosidase/6-phospho-beta-glucosidase/beta-galactosidase
MGWEIFPAGIYFVLRDAAKYGKPIFVTENGIADAQDSKRPDYLTSILKFVNKAIAQGADVRGYFYWSLVDNFEWDKGYWPKFGLLAVDRKTQRRHLRQSAHKYAELIKQYSPS